MSVSSVSLSSDANVRYQRLAQEYTKLRAQAKVLREGVIEERGKVEKLTEDIKSKEAVIRRLQSENESLTFRNDQLARRVETFQFEPQPNSNSSNAKKSSKTTPTLDPSSNQKIELLEQELRRKLEENERLVSQMAENERQHAVEMAEMSEKLAKEMRKLEDEVKRMRMRTKCNNNKIMEVEESGNLESENGEKKREKDHVEMIIGSPEPPESQEEARIMVAEATKGTFSALNNVFTLLQQRCEIYPYDSTMERLPAHVIKLSSEYAQTSRLFSSLVDITDTIIINSVFDTDNELPVITSKCRLISQHCNQMLADLVSQMTSEENRVTWCTAALNKLNNQWEQLILKIFEIFEKITMALETLEFSGDLDLLVGLDQLDTVSTELLECFRQRWIFESRFPTTTRRMRCVGNALEEALQMMSQETSKLAARARRVRQMTLEAKKLEDVKPESPKIPEDLEKTPKAPKPDYNPFFDDDDDFKDASESQEPFSTSSESKKPESLDTTKPSESTTTTSSKKSTSSEPTPSTKEDSESPEVSQAFRSPHDPAHLESELRLLTTQNRELQKERDKLFVDNSLVKRKLEIATKSESSETLQKSDIDQIWSIGMERRDEWIQRVHKAEKALRFYEIEFDLLLRHELASEDHLKQVLAELDTVSQKNHRLEDELESVRRSYESQLGDLSEHLATLVKDREKEKESNKSRGSLKSFFNKS